MKRLLLLFVLASVAVAATAQTGLYKHFANRRNINAYCIERYPLSESDSVCVTLLTTDDSAAYRLLLREIYALPYTPKVKSDIPQPASESLDKHKPGSFTPYSKQKYLIIMRINGLEGDKGEYLLCIPSDRMVVLAFLVRNNVEELNVLDHVLRSEFDH